MRSKYLTAPDMATVYFTVSRPITAFERDYHKIFKSFVSTSWNSNKHYYALQCATTTTPIELLTLTHCSLYTSYTTSCTLSACS